MKQRIIAGILLIFTIILYSHIVASRGPAPIVREKAPVKGGDGWQYYYSEEINPFYPELAPYCKKEGGYVVGNCTWYAWGRACEMAGKKLKHVFLGNAGTWWEQNKKEGYYPYGNKPKRGAIICYKTHVGIVESVDPLIVSESGWKVEKKRAPIEFNYGSPWRSKEKPKGYIYVMD